jgi:hypothetical protein
MLTGAKFLYLAKIFDVVLIDGPLYKLTFLKIPALHKISSYLGSQTFEESFQTTTSSVGSLRAGVAQGGVITLLLFSLYDEDIPSPSQHVERAIYADNTAIMAMSRKPILLVRYPESYLSVVQQWLSEWSISKSTAIIFVSFGRRFIQPRSVTHYGEPIQWVETTHYLGVTIDKLLIWSLTSISLERKLLK